MDAVRHTLTLHDVLNIPDLMYTLILVPVARRKEFKIFINDDYYDPKSGKLKLYQKPSRIVKLLGIQTKEGLYPAVLQVVKAGDQVHLTRGRAGDTRHQRLGHCSDKVAKESVPHIYGITESDSTQKSPSCSSFAEGRSIQPAWKILPPFVKEKTRAIERVYKNLVGPIRQQSHRKSKYFVTLLDDFTGYSLVRFLYLKSEAGDGVIEMIKEIQTLSHSRIGTLTSTNHKTVKWIRSDGGGEYMGHEFQNWIKKRDIVHEVTTAYSPK